MRVFLVSDYSLLVAGIKAIFAGPGSDVCFLGGAPRAQGDEAPWDAVRPEVLLIDVDGDPAGSLAWLRGRPADTPRVLALCREDDPALVDDLMSAGACGVIDARCSAASFLKAIQKVAAGEIWLDRAATARVWSRLSRPFGHAVRVDALTHREREIVEMLVRFGGEPARSLAVRLHMSESTLRNRLTAIYGKCGVSNRAGLVSQVLKNGSIAPYEGA